MRSDKRVAVNTTVAIILAGVLSACSAPNTTTVPEQNVRAGQGPAVISFDHGVTDSLLVLGLESRLLAIPHQGLPDYLAAKPTRFADAGSLRVPDLGGIQQLQPDLVLMTGRQSDTMAKVAVLAPVRNVSLQGDVYKQAVSERVRSVADMFGKRAEADREPDELWRHVANQREALSGTGPVTVVTHNGGNLSLRQDPVVYQLLELDSAVPTPSVQPVVRGERTFYPVDVDGLAEMSPVAVLVVDRSAAIGDEPLQRAQLQQALADRGSEARVMVLEPRLWYLSGGGLQSVRLQVDEVARALR